jgi:apoptosis-inducing factor 3
VEDANRQIAAAEHSKSAVMIGASFISMEVASALRQRGLAVTIVNKEKIPLVKQLGAQMGELILQKHLKEGVRFLLETEVLAITSDDGSASTVKLSNGQELKAGLVVSGIGIVPATAFLRNVPRNDDQSLSVDAFMRVLGVDSMYAAGDLVNFPLAGSNQRVRIEHWRVAQQQAKTAAASMMGLEQPRSLGCQTRAGQRFLAARSRDRKRQTRPLAESSATGLVAAWSSFEIGEALLRPLAIPRYER